MKVLILTAAFALCLSGQNHPAWKDQPFSGDPAEMLKAAQTFSKVDSANIQVLLNSVDEKYDAKGASTVHLRRIYRVLTEQGAKDWGTISASWQPWHEDKPILRCRAIGADGTVHELDPATFAETAAGDSQSDILSDGKRLTAPIPAMAVGTLVEEEVIEHETRPAYEGGSMQRISFDYRGTPVHWARLTIEAPLTLPLRYILNKVPESAVTKTSGDGLTRILIEQGPFEAIDEYPPLLASSVPRHHGVSFSTGDSWRKFAESYSAVVDAQIDGANLKNWTANLKGTREEKIAALMARLHKEIRYTGIEFGDAAIVPHKPNEVIKRKLGDCKDKSTLLVALLRATGVPAYVALLSSGGGADIDPLLPGGGLFDHAIVYVPGTPDYWIDATDEFARLGEIDEANQSRWALIASPDTTALKMIPEGSSKENLTVETREIFLPPFGDARVIETTEVQGAGTSGFRQYYSSRDQKVIKEGLEAYVKEEFSSEGFKKWETADPHDLTRGFWLRIEIEKVKRAATHEQTAAVGFPLYRFTNSLPEFFTKEPDKNKKKESASARQDEFFLRKPFVKEWRYRIHVPDGFRLRKVPEGGKRQFGAVSLDSEYGPLKDGVFTATLRFDSGKTHLSPEEAEATRKAILELRAATSVPVVEFEQTGEALLSQGKVLEALGEFKALCAKHPNSAIDRSRLARALLAAGIGEAARQEAKKATELEPKSAKAWVALGWVLQHDLIGRLRKPGFDLEGALAAYRKAKELDPDEAGRIDMAILLEHNSEGERYTDPTRLAEAIAEYKALGPKLTEAGLSDNLLFALAFAGSFEELKKLAAEGQQTQARRALSLVAITYLGNSEAAVKEAFTWTLSDDARRNILQSASNVLLHMRNYPASADMLTAMSKNSPNAAALLNSANSIRKVKRTEDWKLDDNDPASTSIRYLQQQMISHELHAADLRRFLSKAAGAKLTEEDAKTISRTARKVASGSDLPFRTLSEIGLSVARLSTDGDKDAAMRVKLSFTAQTSETHFLIQEDGQWKIAATSEALGQLGLLARDHALAGRLQIARKLLDWAREATPSVQAEDPVQGAPFARLWERGKEAGVDEILTAAAALSYDQTDDESVVKTLRQAREQVADPMRRAPLDSALIHALQLRKEWKDVSGLTALLMQDFPRSESAFTMRLQALLQGHDFAAAHQMAEARLKIFAEDPDALRGLEAVTQIEGDFKALRAAWNRLDKLGIATGDDLNGLIWSALVDGTANAETVDLALRASQLSPNSFAVLHSAAAVMAQQGKTTEALALILQAMKAAGMPEPEENCWLVLGRIADEVGIPEVAKARYERIVKPKEDGPEFKLTSYALAQKWMKAR